MSELWKFKNYITEFKFISSRHIREYDIKQANINILLYKGIINSKEYKLLSLASRSNRQINVGYLLKDENVNKQFEEGLIEIKKRFFEDNNLEDSDILSIKNDAIYIIDKVPRILCFDNVEFILKNKYIIFMKVLNNLELYYDKNHITGSEVIDIKGIDDSKLIYHKEYILDFILSVLYLVSNGDVESAIKHIQDFYDDYINLKLHVNYYRNFNSFSTFDIVVNNNRYGVSYLDDTSYNKSIIDISYNANMIRNIYSLITYSVI